MGTQEFQHPSSRAGRPKILLMWRGNVLAPEQPTNHPTRLKPLADALAAAGVDTAPLVYFDAEPDHARARLRAADGALVWINPVQDGQDRTHVDAILREAAAAGVWVSAHPDTILKMGTKEVLYSTRELGWGSDTDLYRSAEELELRFPAKLAAGPRVLKPLRGNDGRGVTKVERVAGDPQRVRTQIAYDDAVEVLTLAGFVERIAGTIGAGLIDQAFNPNVSAGMVRCYMSQDRVVGFSEQAPRNLSPTADTPQFGMNSAKTMHGASAEQFLSLRSVMEQEWVLGLQRILGLSTAQLPALWDADFLYRAPQSAENAPSFLLCEINVSSVSPFPDVAAPAIAATVARAIAARRT